MDETTKRQVRAQQSANGRTGPLTATEQAVFDQLLRRHSESLPEAQARLDRERRERERLERKRAKLAAKEERLALQLRTLQADIDQVTDLLTADLSGSARRDVAAKLQSLMDLVPKQQSFLDGHSPLNRAAIMALGELLLTPYQRHERPLRQRSADAPVEQKATEVTAEAILNAGRKRRGEL
jgi:hypothetical protein